MMGETDVHRVKVRTRLQVQTEGGKGRQILGYMELVKVKKQSKKGQATNHQHPDETKIKLHSPGVVRAGDLRSALKNKKKDLR